jgi:hypothetical protein
MATLVVRAIDGPLARFAALAVRHMSDSAEQWAAVLSALARMLAATDIRMRAEIRAGELLRARARAHRARRWLRRVSCDLR